MEFNPSYLAGLIDGEGCIFIARRDGAPGRPAFKIPSYVLTVSICMAHRPLIEGLAEYLDANIQVHKKDLKNPKHKRAYEFVIAGNRARSFLLSIYDFMIIKKEEARLGIMFQDHMNHFRGHVLYMTVPELEKVFEYRERIRLRLKALKKASHIGVTDWNAGEFGEHPMPDLFEMRKDNTEPSRS